MPSLIVVALSFSLVFLLLLLRTKKGEPGKIACLVAFTAWALYAAYEGIYIREWLTTIRGAPIRVDLLFFAPPLLVVSIVALVRVAKRKSPALDKREEQ
jgi:LytS/YehU family sensor histidine kinase